MIKSNTLICCFWMVGAYSSYYFTCNSNVFGNLRVPSNQSAGVKISPYRSNLRPSMAAGSNAKILPQSTEQFKMLQYKRASIVKRLFESKQLSSRIKLRAIGSDFKIGSILGALGLDGVKSEIESLIGEFHAQQSAAENLSMNLISQLDGAIGIEIPRDLTGRKALFARRLSNLIGESSANIILQASRNNLLVSNGDWGDRKRLLKVIPLKQGHPDYPEQKYLMATILCDEKIDSQKALGTVTERNGQFSVADENVEIVQATSFDEIPDYLSHILAK